MGRRRMRPLCNGALAVGRNACGRRLPCASPARAGSGTAPTVPMRAPLGTKAGAGVEVLVRTKEGVVSVRYGSRLGTTFPPNSTTVGCSDCSCPQDEAFGSACIRASWPYRKPSQFEMIIMRWIFTDSPDIIRSDKLNESAGSEVRRRKVRLQVSLFAFATNCCSAWMASHENVIVADVSSGSAERVWAGACEAESLEGYGISGTGHTERRAGVGFEGILPR